jgi:hypothetical protein
MKRSITTATLAILSALALAAPAAADTFKPTRFDDPKPGICKPVDCSLREALNAANATSERDTVRLSAGKYLMQLDPDANLLWGSFEVSTPVVLRGKGPDRTSVSAALLDRVFETAAPVGETITIRGLTVKDGFVAGEQSIGGGIANTGRGLLALRDVALRRNRAGRGGGIAHMNSMLEVTRSTIAGNVAHEGGGIAAYAGQSRPAINVIASTVSGNQAVKGAGVYADGHSINGPERPDLTVFNSTVAANRAEHSGGGVMVDNGAKVRALSATVAHNFAGFNAPGGGNGGGIFQYGDGSLSLTNSIVAANGIAGGAGGRECAGTIHSVGGSVIQRQPLGACVITGSQPYAPEDALVGPLARNGGPTKTVEVRGGSPALGIGTGCPPSDQRGKPRPQPGCDAGAYERPASI